MLNSADEVNDALFIPTLEKLDDLISAFASQLIYKGFSKIYLYKRINKVLSDEDHSYEARIKYLRTILCREIPYSDGYVILKINVTKKYKGILDVLDFKNDIPNDLLNEDIKKQYSSFVSSTAFSKFYIYKCDSAWDSISAIKMARESLSSKLDSFHLGLSELNIEIPNTGLVISTNFCERSTEYILDGGYDLNMNIVNDFMHSIDKIRNDSFIDKNVKERLNSALRHLRIGNYQNELEQRFVNYWIALEFLFSSPEVEESTFLRLKKNLTNVLVASYMKRNILAMRKKLIKNGTLRRDDKNWPMQESGLNQLIDEQDFNSLVERQSSVLLKYHLKQMKSILYGHSDKRKKYISNHEKNVERHIVRIYRLRNELIHEAALKHDIENVTSNLRYYLVFLLCQMINYYKGISGNNELSVMNDFFYSYELYKTNVSQNYDIIDIMKVPLDMRFV